MLNYRQSIRFINPDAIIVLVIVFFGLFVNSNSISNITKTTNHKTPSYVSVSESTAVFSPGIRIQAFQKTWISNKDNFNILAFNRNPISENRKTCIKVSCLQIIRESSHKIPQFILRYHLYPPDEDVPPLLG
jgi:hypothetical protein